MTPLIPAILAFVAVAFYASRNFVLEAKLSNCSAAALLLIASLVTVPIAAGRLAIMKAMGEEIVFPDQTLMIYALILGVFYSLGDFSFLGAFTTVGSILLISSISVTSPIFGMALKYSFSSDKTFNWYQLGGWAFVAIGIIALVYGEKQNSPG